MPYTTHIVIQYCFFLPGSVSFFHSPCGFTFVWTLGRSLQSFVSHLSIRIIKMFYNPRSLLMGAAALLFSGLASAADCANGPWTNVLIIGGGGGGPWCNTKYDQGIVVTGMEVWASKKAVRAVQFYYSDGSNSGMVGKLDDVREHQRIDWDPSKDGISQFKSWGNGNGKYLGRVYLRLKSGGELNVGKDTDGQDVFETDVQSGIMLGAFGNSGDSIDNMGMLFLKSKVSKVTIEDVAFVSIGLFLIDVSSPASGEANNDDRLTTSTT